MKRIANWFLDIWWTVPMFIGGFELTTLAYKMLNASNTMSFWAGLLLWISCAVICLFAGYFVAKKTHSHFFK